MSAFCVALWLYLNHCHWKCPGVLQAEGALGEGYSFHGTLRRLETKGQEGLIAGYVGAQLKDGRCRIVSNSMNQRYLSDLLVEPAILRRIDAVRVILVLRATASNVRSAHCQGQFEDLA